jgi:hypothetical protein
VPRNGSFSDVAREDGARRLNATAPDRAQANGALKNIGNIEVRGAREAQPQEHRRRHSARPSWW